ncbi:MAG: IS200/IS605 family transposase [Candidatus Omnitrophica bacterium]|nr:IS200/IS605 family transposase [Candidatus Omnitrophota bacterium]
MVESERAVQYDLEVSQIEILSDHIHCLVSGPPRIAPSQIAQILKSVSTKFLFKKYKWLRGQYWGGEIWAGGYFVRSIGTGLTREAIARYIKELFQGKYKETSPDAKHRGIHFPLDKILKNSKISSSL